MGGEVDIPALVGGGYGAFWNCRKRYRAVKGGKASKKSCTAALWYIYHLMRLPGANLLAVLDFFDAFPPLTTRYRRRHRQNAPYPPPTTSGR